MPMKCIVIEDEPASREIITDYIQKTPNLELAGTFIDAIEAGNFLNQTQVDLIFLDINIPGLDGVHFYKSLVNPPLVIFTTAYPEYAVEGFELDAVDYLLKPFSFDRFLRAMNKVHAKSNQVKSNDKPYIYLNADKKIHKVLIEDVLFLEALGDYVKVHTQNQMLIVHETLTGLKEQLPDDGFIQTHKSYIVSLGNFDYIEGNMVKFGERAIPISQTYRNDLMERVRR